MACFAPPATVCDRSRHALVCTYILFIRTGGRSRSIGDFRNQRSDRAIRSDLQMRSKIGRLDQIGGKPTCYVDHAAESGPEPSALSNMKPTDLSINTL